MNKKAFIGSFQVGGLKGMCEALEVAQKVTGEPGVDLEAIFYSTAFQSGLEEFILPSHDDLPEPKTQFLKDRTTYLEKGKNEALWKNLRDEFSNYLPEDWYRNDTYSSLWSLQAFLADLFSAMEMNSSLVTTLSHPELAEIKEFLPDELFIPIKNLFEFFEHDSAVLPAPKMIIHREHVERYQEVIIGDSYKNYTRAQKELDTSEIATGLAIEDILNTGSKLFRENKSLLTLKRNALSILDITPKIVDAAFGKLPGTLSEGFAKLGNKYLEERRRIVIYTFDQFLFGLMLKNLVRMIEASENKKERS